MFTSLSQQIYIDLIMKLQPTPPHWFGAAFYACCVKIQPEIKRGSFTQSFLLIFDNNNNTFIASYNTLLQNAL